MKENSKQQKRSVVSEKRLKSSRRRRKFPKKILLKDLISYVSCRKSNSIKFPTVLFRKSIKLVAKNLFRALPHSSENPATSIAYGESFYIKPKNYHGKNLSVKDPSWPHLEIVYQFLSLLLKSPYTNPRLVSHLKPTFILKLMDVFQSEDGRERNALGSVLQFIYQKFYLHREFIRKSVFNLLYNCANEKHNGIQELLILAAIMFVIEEEEGNNLGVQEEFRVFLVRGLIPLYKSNWLALFYLHLNSCIHKFVEKDCKLAGTIIKGMLKHWPIASSSREYFFLDGVERVLSETQPDDFRSNMVPLFRRPHCKLLEQSTLQGCRKRAVFLLE